MRHRTFLKFTLFILLLSVLFSWMLFSGTGPEEKNISWGVTFSVPQSEYLGISWQQAYVALMDDMRVKKFRLIAEWDNVESTKDSFNFSAIDWQLAELEKRQGKAIVTIGMKVPRWPECHVPGWAKDLSKEAQQEEIISYLQESVRHLASSKVIYAWQIENEPLFPFGECPWHTDVSFLKREIAAVKAIDPTHPIIVTGSGEWTMLLNEARLGDIIGTTLYRRVFLSQLGVFADYPFSSASYDRKAYILKSIFGKEVINVELQAEPWNEHGLKGATKEENDKTFSLADFKGNIQFALHSGHKEAYLWGAEWWYYMKERGYPEYWDEAKKLF